MEQNLYAWFFEGGIVGVPKRLLGLMEPLGLDFTDLGKLLYILYCGEGGIKNDDRYALEAARTLEGKGLLHWDSEKESVDFSPMFELIAQNLGGSDCLPKPEAPQSAGLDFAGLQKKLEREQGRFLTLKEKQDLEMAAQRYSWSYELLYDVFVFYRQNFRRHAYDFQFFCRMAYGAKVSTPAEFKRFTESLETTNVRVQEVLRRLGKYNNPTEKQKELYLKWVNTWKFTHEMVLLAADENIAADNPSVAYTDSVLQSWYNEGIASPEDLQARKQSQEQKKEILKESKRSKRGKQDSFSEGKRDLANLIE